jgi:hypothetical protein
MPRRPDDIVGGTCFVMREELGLPPITYRESWHPKELQPVIRRENTEEAEDPSNKQLIADWGFGGPPPKRPNRPERNCHQAP